MTLSTDSETVEDILIAGGLRSHIKTSFSAMGKRGVWTEYFCKGWSTATTASTGRLEPSLFLDWQACDDPLAAFKHHSSQPVKRLFGMFAYKLPIAWSAWCIFHLVPAARYALPLVKGVLSLCASKEQA